MRIQTSILGFKRVKIETFLILNTKKCAREPASLAGKRGSRRHSTTSFSENDRNKPLN